MTDWSEIEQAREKAHEKHGNNSIERMFFLDPRWMPVLVEEVGEVAHELTYDADGDLRAELVDLLAVASAWLDAIDRTRNRPKKCEHPAEYRYTRGWNEFCAVCGQGRDFGGGD